MSYIDGKYKLVKNENTDQYFAAVGVPYLVRKMISASSPTLEVLQQDSNNFVIKNISLLRTAEQKFTLGEEYDEEMPNNKSLKSTSSMEDANTLITKSVDPQTGESTLRTYLFAEDSCVLVSYYGLFLEFLKSGLC